MLQEYHAQQPTRAPSHPGALLREVVLPALKMSVTDAAKNLFVTRQQLHRILAGASGISPEMALRLGKFCGNGPDLWIGMQQAYDLWHASKKVGRQIDRIKSFELT